MKKIILFAGAVGCSKTPTAFYLSQQLNLPIFSNDVIRTEVMEDLGFLDEVEYVKRRNERFLDLVLRGISFVNDPSIDRQYQDTFEILEKYGYEFFVVSFDLSKEFLRELYKIKKYEESLANLDQLFLDHENFLKINQDLVGVRINDESFPNRLELVLEGVENLLI